MKIKLTSLKLIAAACALAATSVLGQVTYTWTGTANGTNLATAGNWTPTGGPPSGATSPTGDTGEWNGTASGPLNITYTAAAGLPSTGYGTYGVTWYVNSAQTSPVTITDPIDNSGTIAFNNITIDSGAGAVTFGDGTAHQLNFIGRPAGYTHVIVNNSAHAATIGASVRWQAGGGSAYVLDFQGNDWVITNYLRNDNGSGPTTIAWEGPGTMYWNSDPVQRGNSPTGPIEILGGTVVLEGANLCPVESAVATGNNVIQNAGVLIFNAPAVSDNIGRSISGGGPLQVNAGTLTLSGANTYSGNTILQGGELIAGKAEPGGPLSSSALISFTGGTLGFSAVNQFDYSPIFDTSANQKYSFDTAGQNVTFATDLASSGGTLAKVGPGTLTLNGTSSYSGATTVSAGKLVFAGAKTGSGNITVADSAALGVTVGTQVTPGTLALGTSSGAILEFNGITSTTTAPIAATTLSSSGTLTINVNSGTFAVGQVYPLITWTSGSAPTVALGALNGAVGNLSVSGNTLNLTITGLAYTWTGNGDSIWNITSANNWKQNGSPVAFANGGASLFDDTAPGSTSVSISGVVTPASVAINNSTLTYSITSTSGNDIGGTGKLTKNGAGTLTLSGGANAYTGVTTVSGGTLSVGALANGGSASDIGAAANSAASLVLNGGTLQYTGGAAGSDHLFTLGTGGGTIDASGTGALNLNNAGSAALSGTGARVLTLTGTDTDNNTLAAALADNGGATSLAKNGAGTWVLTGNNAQSGATTIAAGTLQIGLGGATGAIGTGSIVNNGSLDFNRTGTLTVSGAISGSGSVTNDGTGTVVLAGNNTYSGGTTINAGTLQVGNGGATGSLNAATGITNNGTLVFNTTGGFTLNGAIDGSGTVIQQGSGLLKLLGNETYTNTTTIASGANLQIFQGNQGSFVGMSIIDNGTLLFVRQDYNVAGIAGVISGSGPVIKDVNNANPGTVTFSNNMTYAGGTIIAGGGIILGDGVTSGFGSIVGNVVFTNSGVSDDNKFIEFNRPDNVTFPGVISGSGSTVGGNQGQLIAAGPGNVTLTGNSTYVGSTIISNCVLQVGTGGTTGAIGSTNTVTDWGTLIFDRSDSVTLLGGINGSGLVSQAGSGTLTLAGNLAINATTIVTNNDLTTTTNVAVGSIAANNGTLVLNPPNGNVVNDLTVSGGTLVAGGVGSVSTLNVFGNLNISSGTVVAALNKSLVASNTTFVVSNALARTGGSLQLVNYGPALVVGDKFTIFNKAVTGGAGTTIVSTGFTVNNNLAVDGSVTVASVVAATPPTLTNSVSGGNYHLSWPSGTGLNLYAQTNTLSAGLKSNWVLIPGYSSASSFSAPVNTASNTCVFYRLAP